MHFAAPTLLLRMVGAAVAAPQPKPNARPGPWKWLEGSSQAPQTKHATAAPPQVPAPTVAMSMRTVDARLRMS